MTTATPLTPVLLQAIQRGDAILFLGAGASIGAKGKNGEAAPSGNQLRDMLCDLFLGGSLKDKSLAQVSELAKNESSLPAVQQAIKKVFEPLRPAGFHNLIPLFRWFAIVTTNYDLVIEQAYSECEERQQILAPILQDGDQFSEKLRDASQVIYLKLHGCITHITDPNLPLILASEEYAKHLKNRTRLFRHFADWARERPIIFCGYDVGDPNIQQILFDLADMGIQRPSYALVNSNMDEILVRYWASKRFVIYVSTFEKFLNELDSAIPRHTRGLGALLKTTNASIQPWIKSQVSPTTELLTYLQDELEHVYKGMPTSGIQPKDFYKGLKITWGAVAQGLDVRRRVSDDIILEAFLENAGSSAGQAYLLKGHAGSGKSVTLRRIAWDIANDFDGFVFFLREGGILRWDKLAELSELTGQRFCIVIEDAIPHIKDIQTILSKCENYKNAITFILGARTNEWNVYSGSLEERVENGYELRDLTEREITQLVKKLGDCGALGRLTNSTTQEQLSHFKLTAERQILVALHDLSSQKPFEEIVFDEYKNIVPPEARILYMDVCTLHRLGVGVRAGLISRISGITFESFGQDFFKPLEHVVRTYFDYACRDNMYRSRHPLIADMVFKQALPDPLERANQIIRIIRNMDVDYESDQVAFRQIVRGKLLADLFANKAIAYQIFDAAKESGAPLSSIEHQRAVFELHHPSKNLRAAMEAIERAEAASDHVDRAILHTKASILRNLALDTPQKLAKEKLREEAKSIVRKNLRTSRVSHSYHTIGQILIDELRDKMAELAENSTSTPAELHERAIADLIRQGEEIIHDGLQRFPGDEFLLTLEAQFAQLLEDEKRALDALQSAFEVNPGRSFVAVRLANSKNKQGATERAIEILKRSLSVNSASKETHFAIAKILQSKGEEENRDEISYHLKRSFTSGDSNLEAQFWCARHNFLFGDRQAGITAFRDLARTNISPEYRNRIKGIVNDKNNTEIRYRGTVKAINNGYCFINSPDFRADMFSHMNDFSEEDWSRLSSGSSVSFRLGFAFRGPIAFDVRLNK